MSLYVAIKKNAMLSIVMTMMMLNVDNNNDGDSTYML